MIAFHHSTKEFCGHEGGSIDENKLFYKSGLKLKFFKLSVSLILVQESKFKRIQ